jgi:hypothetical protein
MNQLLLLGLVFFALQGTKRDLPVPPRDLPTPDPDRDPIDGSQEPVDTTPPCNITQGYYQPIGGPKLPMDTPAIIPFGNEDSVRHNTYYVRSPGNNLPKWVVLKGNVDTAIESYNPYNYTIESNCA